MSQCYLETIQYLAFNTSLVQTGLIKGLSVSLVRGRISKGPARVSVASLSFRSFFPLPGNSRFLLFWILLLPFIKSPMLCHSNPFCLQFLLHFPFFPSLPTFPFLPICFPSLPLLYSVDHPLKACSFSHNWPCHGLFPWAFLNGPVHAMSHRWTCVFCFFVIKWAL